MSVPAYPALAVATAVGVVTFEMLVLRTRIFRDRAYWLAMTVCLVFMIPVDGWLTKASAPIVVYRAVDTTRLHPIWNILVEEYAYAFALLTLAMVMWDRLARSSLADR